MNTNIKITLDMSPVACPRPRVTSKGVYYPKRYTAFKKESKIKLMNQCKMNIPKDQLLHINYTFISRRQSAICKGEGRKFKPTRPDLDNYIKAINDSLQAAGIIEDDSQIVSMSAKKLFGRSKEKASIELEIELI